MRKIIAITISCFLFLLMKNENANSKANCDVTCNTFVKQPFLPVTVENTAENEPVQYDGFFFKI